MTELEVLQQLLVLQNTQSDLMQQLLLYEKNILALALIVVVCSIVFALYRGLKSLLR